MCSFVINFRWYSEDVLNYSEDFLADDHLNSQMPFTWNVFAAFLTYNKTHTTVVRMEIQML